MPRSALAAAAALLLTGASGVDHVDEPSPPPAQVVYRLAAPEARQGAASDGTYVYAIDNNRIGKYRIADRRRVASWQGDRRLFPHMNSCTVAGRELVCAASNYPAVPQTSAIEVFDAGTLKHVRSISLGVQPGSLTVMDRHAGHWWAVFANYAGKGGEPGRDHRYTMLSRMDESFQIQESWVFPAEVLARMAPRSCSGLSWGPDGLIYATGHDRPEVYVLRLPEAGSTLDLVATLGIASPGQAIDWEPNGSRLWSVARDTSEVLASSMQPSKREAIAIELDK
jgi:hypothetical protein